MPPSGEPVSAQIEAGSASSSLLADSSMSSCLERACGQSHIRNISVSQSDVHGEKTVPSEAERKNDESVEVQRAKCERLAKIVREAGKEGVRGW